MAGTWAAFKVSIVLISIVILIMIFASILRYLQGSWQANFYAGFLFIDLALLLMMLWSNRRITQLFHYRRVSELFHIVQSAYLAQQMAKKKK